MVATSVWRAGALTATLCAIAFVAYHPTLPAREDFGITGDGPLVRTNVRAISIASRSSAERAGIRPGDRIAYPTWPLDFARAAFPAPGDRVTLTVNDRRRVTLIAARPPPAGIPWWITAVRLAFLLVAGLLAWRRPADRAARALFTFLLCFGIAIALDSGSLPWPLASFMLMQVFISIFFVAGIAAIAVFAALFPSDDARPVLTTPLTTAGGAPPRLRPCGSSHRCGGALRHFLQP